MVQKENGLHPEALLVKTLNLKKNSPLEGWRKHPSRRPVLTRDKTEGLFDGYGLIELLKMISKIKLSMSIKVNAFLVYYRCTDF